MKIVKYSLPAFLLLLVFVSCSTKAKQEGSFMDTDKDLAKASLSAQIISTASGGYGYEIFMDDVKIISQPHRPSSIGLEGFATKEDAEKVATLVIGKIKANTIPPSVSQEELDSLGIK